VSERTASLEKAVAELEQISYSTIHDLRAPLRTVQSFGEIPQEDPQSQLSPEGHGMLGKMREAASRMEHG
jgi:light-regulated signal transduction histidine kinase (bacteriophytochrome)